MTRCDRVERHQKGPQAPAAMLHHLHAIHMSQKTLPSLQPDTKSNTTNGSDADGGTGVIMTSPGQAGGPNTSGTTMTNHIRHG